MRAGNDQTLRQLFPGLPASRGASSPKETRPCRFPPWPCTHPARKSPSKTCHHLVRRSYVFEMQAFNIHLWCSGVKSKISKPLDNGTFSPLLMSSYVKRQFLASRLLELRYIEKKTKVRGKHGTFVMSQKACKILDFSGGFTDRIRARFPKNNNNSNSNDNKVNFA